MSRPDMPLRKRLGQAGIVMAGDDEAPVLSTPWFVRALQAVSGWLAAVFLLGFIALGAAFVIESSVASAMLGLVMIAAAYALLHKTPGDFVEHLALAVSLAGQLLVTWALGSALNGVSADFWWALLGLQVVLAMVMPSITHRTFSAFAASLALYAALAESGMPYLAGGLVLLAATWIWLNEFRWPLRMRQIQALGYGLLLGLPAIQLLGRFGQPLLGWRSGLELGALTWLGEVLAALALLLLLRHVFHHREHDIGLAKRIAAYGAVAVLLLASLQAHGLSQGAVVVALGFAIGNRLWHSDASFKAVPAKYSLLRALTIPPKGGNTEFAHMGAAYETLDDDTKALIADLVCEHSQLFSRAAIGFTEFTPEERERFRPVRQRLVRTLPRTGRKSLYLSSHAGTIVGWPLPEARLLLRDLTEHATQREFVYSHQWQVNDLVIWDNLATMHRARAFDDATYRRELRRVTTLDLPPEAHEAQMARDKVWHHEQKALALGNDREVGRSLEA